MRGIPRENRGRPARAQDTPDGTQNKRKGAAYAAPFPYCFLDFHDTYYCNLHFAHFLPVSLDKGAGSHV
jgi:hypothetical protein